MKCDCCRFAPSVDAEGFQDDCPVFDDHGTVWKDGREGCTLSYSHLKKMEEKYAQYLGEMGTDMGLEMTLEQHGLSLDKAVKTAKHMIGIYPEGCRRAYVRHKKTFYRPYRNYFCGQNACLEIMAKEAYGLVVRYDDEGKYPYYTLTRTGLDWLGRNTGIKIHDPER